MQSPIDITTYDAITNNSPTQLLLNYSTTVDDILDTGHAVQVALTGTATLMNREFELLQLHFHSPSEHTIDGEYFDFEAHFVHQAQNGRLAVVGVLFKVGEENVELGEILSRFSNDELSNSDFELNLLNLFPDDQSYYHYTGSLTTPPLTENVEWYVLENSLELSQQQLDEFKLYYDHNSRDIQGLYGRVILYTED
ncbi:MAG: hypothetical protein ATN33_02650 [Epulopiscium sp. Nele67-Bin001]|nr:MAG: hypothetical protein BEN18_04780 [Epulopiscium sp. Nuni2H_MBin001]OON90580.1 MAG: hypothetical protein ATN33_02650 [Epulopiscium sp. Nele67-Bin001]